MSSKLVMRQPLALRLVSSILLSGFTVMLAAGGLASGAPFSSLGPMVAAVAAFVTVRNWRLRVVVSPAGLVIANLMRTHDLDWTDVDRVVNEGGAVIRLLSGQQVSVTAFADVPGALPQVRRRNERAAKQLQAAIKRYRKR